MKTSTFAGGLGLGAVVFVSTLSTGCGYTKQARDTVHPTAVPAMMAAQTLNPDAGRNRKVVAGLDGAAGENVSDAYAKSFQRQKAQVGGTESFQGLSGLSSD